MYWRNDHMTGSAALVMVLLVCAVLGVLVLAAYLLIRQAPSRPRTASNAARAVLDDRLARGDIDAEDYQRRRALLTDHQR